MKYLEWIEGTGDQYIDTLFTPNQNSCIELEFSYTTAISSNNALFGVRKATSENNFSIMHPYGYPLSFYSCNAYYNSTLNPPVLNRKYKVKLDRNKVYIDDTLVHTFSLVNFTCPYTALLWGMKNNADSRGFSGKFRMYSCKIWDDGTLVREYAPAKDNNNVVCLYDEVSQTFYYNLGSNVFSAGPEIPTTKYLLQDGNSNYWTISGGSLTQVIGTFNAQMFIDNGMDNIPSWSDYSSLTNPSLLCWAYDSMVDMTATTTGVPGAQTVTSSDITAFPPGASGIGDVSITETGSPKYAFSVDSGTTWKVWSGSAWVASSGVANDMSSATVEAITQAQWDSLISGQTYIKVRFTLFSDSDSVSEISVNYA